MPPDTKYIDPLIDFAFKRIFGSDPNKDLLIAFLNEVFRGRKHIADLVYNKNEHPGDLVNEGGAVFDLLCTGDDGEHFMIEVQRGKQENFKQRALFYTSRLISGLAPKGRRSDWGYNLPEVYLIALLEDFILEDSPAGQFIHDICLCDRNTGKIFYNRLFYTYIELRKFVKTDAELETDLDRWLFVLKNMSRMDKIPVYLRKTVFEKLFNIAEYSTLTKEEKMKYDSYLKYKWDNENVRAYAIKEREQAIREGIEEGVKKGVEEGIKEAVAEAVAEAVTETVTAVRAKTLEDIATEMKKDGVPSVQILKFTKLTIEELEKL